MRAKKDLQPRIPMENSIFRQQPLHSLPMTVGTKWCVRQKELRSVLQSTKPISSSMTAAKPLRAGASPLLTGGHSFCRMRRASASRIAAGRSLNGLNEYSISEISRSRQKLTSVARGSHIPELPVPRPARPGDYLVGLGWERQSTVHQCAMHRV